jgi:fatty acid desaturase
MLIGALQHHLATLAHEAVHHILFKSKRLNFVASEWLCSLPIFSSTFHYGLHHLAHHQFVNDPVRDPDISQMETSGHRLSFPILRNEFLKVLVQQRLGALAPAG